MASYPVRISFHYIVEMSGVTFPNDQQFALITVYKVSVGAALLVTVFLFTNYGELSAKSV